MEGKLIKTDNTYILSVNEHKDEVFAIADNNKAHELNKHKLSLKNCEAIANGYDLDELANRAFDNMGYHSTVTPYEEKQFKLGYRVAFRESIELLGDKKFSVKDMEKLMFATIEFTEQKEGETYPFLKSFIQSLQQTEWDVEICCYIGNGDEESDSCKDRFVTNTGIPKLDENKCLILKRK